jgi:hypothetical protein
LKNAARIPRQNPAFFPNSIPDTFIAHSKLLYFTL